MKRRIVQEQAYQEYEIYANRSREVFIQKLAEKSRRLEVHLYSLLTDRFFGKCEVDLVLSDLIWI